MSHLLERLEKLAAGEAPDVCSGEDPFVKEAFFGAALKLLGLPMTAQWTAGEVGHGLGRFLGALSYPVTAPLKAVARGAGNLAVRTGTGALNTMLENPGVALNAAFGAQHLSNEMNRLRDMGTPQSFAPSVMAPRG